MGGGGGGEEKESADLEVYCCALGTQNMTIFYFIMTTAEEEIKDMDSGIVITADYKTIHADFRLQSVFFNNVDFFTNCSFSTKRLKVVLLYVTNYCKGK